MTFFDNLTSLLKQKWLQFFQVNRSWIVRHMDVESVYTPDGGRRPPSYLILGVINALEPQLAELMLPFSKLNPDADALIDVLELNFDPDFVLGNRFNPQAVLDELDDNSLPSMVIAVNPDELIDVSLDEIADEVVLVETDDESILVLSADEADELIDVALDEIADEVVLMETDEPLDALGDMSLDEIADAMGLEQLDDESLETQTATRPDELGDVVSDVWNEQTSSDSEQANDENHSGKEKQSEHDSDISRLFPDS